MKKIFVDIGHLKIAKNHDVLETLSLGSCVGVVLYDPVAKVGGLAHIMLPESALAKDKARKEPAKYADTAIPLMIKKMIQAGAKRPRINARIIGGANMFKKESERFPLNIGERNIEAAKNVLEKAKIPVVAEDIGKDYGRTVEFEVISGKVLIKSSLRGRKEL
ncbi:MAG: chemotaxis protein CheD [Candidatus Aminicenantales bacterium]